MARSAGDFRESDGQEYSPDHCALLVKSFVLYGATLRDRTGGLLITNHGPTKHQQLSDVARDLDPLRDVAMDQRVSPEIGLDRRNPSQPLYAQGGHSIGHSRTFGDIVISESDRAQVVSLFKRGANPEYIRAEICSLKLWEVYAVIAQHLHEG